MVRCTHTRCITFHVEKKRREFRRCLIALGILPENHNIPSVPSRQLFATISLFSYPTTEQPMQQQQLSEAIPAFSYQTVNQSIQQPTVDPATSLNVKKPHDFAMSFDEGKNRYYFTNDAFF